MRTVATRYDVSDVALKKICRRLAIPTPEAGYWNKRPGARSPRPLLPAAPEGVGEVLDVHRYDVLVATVAQMPESLRALMKLERSRVIEVSASLIEPHPMIGAAAALVARLKPDAEGMLCTRGRRCLTLYASPLQAERALRIMDSLLKALHERDMRVEIANVEPSSKSGREAQENEAACRVRVSVRGAWVILEIAEKRRLERPPGPTPPKGLNERELMTWKWRHPSPEPYYVPTGILELFADCGGQRASWRDGKRRLETLLPDVVARLHALAYRRELAAEEVARERAERERQEAREAEARRLAAEQERIGKDFLAGLERWRTAKVVREFIAEMRAVLDETKWKLDDNSDLAKTLRWAEGHASRIDPLARLRDEIAALRAEQEK
ncbi:MAG: hypothetical protein F9K40_01695 [Kofleriaceae bacterium]|nr:MAG: hypothetical protein F9K40_01695 [Kofleriaceae bacterium]